MTRRVHLVHGIHTPAGSPVVQGLIPFLENEGFEVLYPDYGYELAIATRQVNPMLIGMMLPYIQKGDLYVGHSNGCAIGYELMRRGAPITGAAFINAALDSAIEIPSQLKFLDVYFNAGDQLTEAAKVGAWMQITDAVWGEMGHTGYSGDDDRVRSHDCEEGPAPCYGHSALFNPVPELMYWGPIVAKTLREKSDG